MRFYDELLTALLTASRDAPRLVGLKDRSTWVVYETPMDRPPNTKDEYFARDRGKLPMPITALANARLRNALYAEARKRQ